MMLRSLRWRLVLAMVLIIAAMAGTAALLSSLTVRREMNRMLLAQRRDVHRAAAQLVRRAGVPKGLEEVHERYGLRSVVFDARGTITHRYPPDLGAYSIRREGKHLHLRRRGEDLVVIADGIAVPGAGIVYLLPPREPRNESTTRTVQVAVSRWMLGGLLAAALLAVLVMLTIFRRLFAPVEALTAGARSLASGRLETRVDVRGGDEVAELAGAFNAMADALERNERARRNMVSDIAHELRTPLTNIRAHVEAVQDGVMTADAKWIASIEEEAALLARLVDDLQQLSLAEAGQLRLELAEVGVDELVERALSGLDLRGLAVTRDVAPGLTLRADARRIVQVLRNLLVNATAYAQSAIAISAREDGDRIELRVADDGPGIAPEHAERVFDRFYRADASRSRRTGGAGLGLAIAKELVELHGGTIRYEKPAFVLTFINS